MIEKGARTSEDAIDSNGFVTRAYFSGRLVLGNPDHGLGPLATIMESFLSPGTHITLHEHVVDEIVSWVPAGVMRQDDPRGGHLTVDAEHLMIMSAGRGSEHKERTRDNDPPLRMLQIFVSPHAAGLEPAIQYGRLAEPRSNAWRHVFGPLGSDTAFHVRNAVHCHDIQLSAGRAVALPLEPGGTTYFFVFSGCVSADGNRFAEAESGLLADTTEIALEAVEDAVVLAFLVDPTAEICRGDTVGDSETVHAVAARARP